MKKKKKRRVVKCMSLRPLRGQTILFWENTKDGPVPRPVTGAPF